MDYVYYQSKILSKLKEAVDITYVEELRTSYNKQQKFVNVTFSVSLGHLELISERRKIAEKMEKIFTHVICKKDGYSRIRVIDIIKDDLRGVNAISKGVLSPTFEED